MGIRARVLVGAIWVGLATSVAGPAVAAGVDGGSIVCDPIDNAAGLHISCTVLGPEGSEVTLVLVTTDAAGSEHVTSSKEQLSGDSATFTQPVPDGADNVIAIGLVDGVEADSAVVTFPDAADADPVALGAPGTTVGLGALAALTLGALFIFVSTRRRSVERRSGATDQGVLT